MSEGADGTYPQLGHVLRLLALEIAPAVGDDVLQIAFPVWPSHCAPGAGVRAGIVATAADVVGGMLAARTVHPDWMATSGLALDQRRPAARGTVTVEAGVLRVGRTAVVLDFSVFDDDGDVGHGTMSFARLVRRDSNPEIIESARSGGVSFVSEDATGQVPIADAIGIRSGPVPSSVELDLTDGVRNSLGSVQGGVLGLVAELAAERASAEALGRPAHVLDLAIDYVQIAKVGPVRATAEVVRVNGDVARCRVEVIDLGTERLAVIAHVTAVAT